MSTLKAQGEFTPERDATVQSALDNFIGEDLIRDRKGVKANFGRPTNSWVSELGSEEPLPSGAILKAETRYQIWWEWTGLPEFPKAQQT